VVAMLAVLQRLSEDVEHMPVEFGQLVEKQDPIVGQADFAWPRGRASADGSPASEMVWWGDRNGRVAIRPSFSESRPAAE
jgi:hypothetical protein